MKPEHTGRGITGRAKAGPYVVVLLVYESPDALELVPTLL
jgi:hypothetical protein